MEVSCERLWKEQAVMMALDGGGRACVRAYVRMCVCMCGKMMQVETEFWMAWGMWRRGWGAVRGGWYMRLATCDGSSYQGTIVSLLFFGFIELVDGKKVPCLALVTDGWMDGWICIR